MSTVPAAIEAIYNLIAEHEKEFKERIVALESQLGEKNREIIALFDENKLLKFKNENIAANCATYQEDNGFSLAIEWQSKAEALESRLAVAEEIIRCLRQKREWKCSCSPWEGAHAIHCDIYLTNLILAYDSQKGGADADR